MPSTNSTPKAEWSVMVFLNAKNDLEPFSFANFDQMASVGSTDKVNVLVEYGRPRHNYSNEYGGWSKTLRFRVTRGMKPTVASALEDLEQVNMGEGKALTEFVNWARDKYPARREMLVIWDHGQGWRVRTATSVRGGERDRYVALRRELRARAMPGSTEAPPVPETARIHGGFRYVSHDEDTGDKLYNREIQDALAVVARKRKLDVISFDACLMAMLETGYALRKAAKVMVGSEELEPGAGWNYQRWLAPLVADPAGQDAAKLGQLLVSAYRDEYGNNDDTTLSAVNLARIPALARKVTAFADRARAKLTGQLRVLKKARQACLNYAPGYGLHSIDLARFLAQVRDDAAADTDLRHRAQAALKALAAAVIDNYASTRRQGGFGSGGVAIYFPASKFAFNSDPDRQGYMPDNTQYPVEFVDKERWGRFLHSYFDKVPS
jgi:Clostripain family